MAIYDCFTFFNEFEVLEIRLNELAPVVDHFVIVEASTTFAGDPKPYLFSEKQSAFSEFADKITVIRVDDLPVLPNRWVAEQVQRNAIVRGLETAADHDLVIISDVDEVPRARSLSELPQMADGDIVGLVMEFYNYALNLRMPEPWYAARVTRRSTLRYLTPQEVRRTFVKNPTQTHPGRQDSVRHAGWHFSLLAPPEDLVSRIQAKAQAYSHDEADHGDVLNPARLQHLVARRHLWWDASYSSVPLVPVPLDDSFPEYVVTNRQRWAPFVADFPVGARTLARSRQFAVSAAHRVRRAYRALRAFD